MLVAACIVSVLECSSLPLPDAGALSSSAKIGCVSVFGAPSTRLQLLKGLWRVRLEVRYGGPTIVYLLVASYPEGPGTRILRDSLFHLIGRSWCEAFAQKGSGFITHIYTYMLFLSIRLYIYIYTLYIYIYTIYIYTIYILARYLSGLYNHDLLSSVQNGK